MRDSSSMPASETSECDLFSYFQPASFLPLDFNL